MLKQVNQMQSSTKNVIVDVNPFLVKYKLFAQLAD